MELQLRAGALIALFRLDDKEWRCNFADQSTPITVLVLIFVSVGTFLWCTMTLVFWRRIPSNHNRLLENRWLQQRRRNRSSTPGCVFLRDLVLASNVTQLKLLSQLAECIIRINLELRLVLRICWYMSIDIMTVDYEHHILLAMLKYLLERCFALLYSRGGDNFLLDWQFFLASLSFLYLTNAFLISMRARCKFFHLTELDVKVRVSMTILLYACCSAIGLDRWCCSNVRL